MTINTIKFSEMTPGGDLPNNSSTPGLLSGNNVLFNNPWTFLPPGSTASRPSPSPEINYRLRFNTDDQLYEYYDAISGLWTQLQETTFTTGPYVTYTASISLPDAFNLGTLPSGILKQTSSLGIATPAIAINGTDYYGPGFTGYFQSPQGVKDVNGNNIVQWSTAGSSSINWLNNFNSTAGNPVGLSALGTDTNIGLNINTKGNAPVTLTTAATNNAFLIYSGTTSQHLSTFSFFDTSASRTYTFPDASGTIALTSGIPSLGDFTFSGDTMSTATVNSNMSIIPNGNGQLQIGSSTQLFAQSAGYLRVQIAKSGYFGFLNASTFTNNSGASQIALIKSRSTSIGSFVAVQNLDNLGSFIVYGDDGTQISPLPIGELLWSVQGSVSAGIIPTMATISTSNTSGTLVRALTISNAQIVTLANPLPVGSGGLGITTTPTNGQIPIGNGTNYTTSTITAGTNIAVSNGSGSITIGITGVIGGSNGGTGVNNGSNTLTLGGNLTTSGAFNSTFTMTAGTSVTFPTSGTLATTSQLPTPAALTSSNDTNVTITLGGTPSTALLQATSLTMGWTGQLSLTRGGSNASLSPSNGGIVFSTASAMAILSGTSTAGQLLLSGSSTAPTWSTSTYPSTNAINTLLYASSANTMAALATANSGVLVTSAGGVPSISTTLPNSLAMGTPASLTLTNASGLPISGITGLGTGVGTALAVNTNSTGGFPVETDGTFTPVLSFGGGSTGIAYTTRQGIYTTIGNTITFSIYILLSSKGSSTGAAAVSGLPFNARAGVNIACATLVPGFSFTGTGDNVPIAYISPGTSFFGFLTYGAAGNGVTVTDTNFTNTSTVAITGTYLI